jgi:predicted CoA-binding protein
MKRERVVLLGASEKPERYAFQAFRLLREHGHEVVPVNPALGEIDGVTVVRRPEDVTGPVDTVTVYLRPEVSWPLADAVVALRPRRVIFNPGTESAEWKERLAREGIEAEDACTLVLLRTGQF